jgi:hypothetical protein
MEYKLIDEILKLSSSKSWETAKLEWSFVRAFEGGPQSCLCGHYPIKNICVIHNSKSKKSAEVGNCCVNKFLGIEEGNKIFETLKRLKGDIGKSMSAEALQFLFDRAIINEFEYVFYKDILRKRNLTNKQEALKKSVNRKFLSFTSPDTNIIQSMFDGFSEWSADNPWFDCSFVNSLEEYYKRNGKLSEKQAQALNNIMGQFGIS